MTGVYPIIKKLERGKRYISSSSEERILARQRHLERVYGIKSEVVVKYIKSKPHYYIKRT